LIVHDEGRGSPQHFAPRSEEVVSIQESRRKIGKTAGGWAAFSPATTVRVSGIFRGDILILAHVKIRYNADVELLATGISRHLDFAPLIGSFPSAWVSSLGPWRPIVRRATPGSCYLLAATTDCAAIFLLE